jgi:hypothetical protein
MTIIMLLVFYGAVLAGFYQAKQEANPCWRPGPVFWIVNGFIVFCLIAIGIESLGESGNSSPAPTPTCKYPGCVEPRSEFWNSGTGYCNHHADQLRKAESLRYQP